MRTFYFKSDDPMLPEVEEKLNVVGITPAVSTYNTGFTIWEVSGGNDIKAIKKACKANKLHWLNANKIKKRLVTM